MKKGGYMKKAIVTLLSLALLVSFALASSGATPKMVLDGRSISTALEKSSPAAPSEKAMQPKMNQRMMRNMARPDLPNYSRIAQKFSMPAVKNDVSLDKSTLTVLVNGSVDTIYEPMTPITFRVESANPVQLRFFVDNGDGYFTPGYEFEVMAEDSIIVMDGDEMDMSPAGDGVWEVTLDPENDEIGEEMMFLIVPGLKFFLYGEDLVTMATGYAAVEVEETVTDFSISGNVSMEGPMGMEIGLPGLLVISFPMPDNWDEPVSGKEDDDMPLGMSLCMTGLTGDYSMYVMDEVDTLTYAVLVVDFFGLYPGLFPEPPMQMIPVNGHITGVDFMMLEGNELIFGTVSDVNGAPLAGYTVYINNDMVAWETVTDENGYYEFTVVPGFYDLWLEYNELAGTYFIPEPQYVFVEPDMKSETEASFVVYPVNPNDIISGRVTTSSGEGVADLVVFAYKFPVGHSPALTDADGYFQILVNSEYDSLEVQDDWGSWINYGYFVSVNMDGDMIVSPPYYDMVFSGTDSIDFMIISPDAMVFGVVTDSATAMPLPYAELQYYSEEYFFWTSTDENGYYEANLLGDRAWFVEVYYPNHYMMPALVDSFYVESTGVMEFDYAIAPPSMSTMFHGYVFDIEGMPATDATVEISNEMMTNTVQTDAMGYFEFTELPVFEGFDVKVTYGDYAPIQDYIWTDIYPTYREYWFGSGDALLTVIVKDLTGAAISNALVLVDAMNGQFHSFTDENGFADPLWLNPGYVQILAGANGFFADSVEYVFAPNDTVVFFLEDASASLTESVSAMVSTENSEPIEGAFLLWHTDNYMGYTWSEPDGSYSLNLIPGFYVTIVQKPGFLPEWRFWDVPNENEDYNIVMYPDHYEPFVNIYSVEDVPDDHGKQVRLSFEVVVPAPAKERVAYFIIFRGINDGNSGEISGWDYVDTLVAHPGMNDYNIVVPTLYDAVGEEIFWTPFMVSMVLDTWWTDSNILEGYSMDNLPPSAPYDLIFSSVDQSSVDLLWVTQAQEPIKYFTIYRQLNGGDYEFLDYSTEHAYTDFTANEGDVVSYYVTATDYGLNESDASNIIFYSPVSIENAIPSSWALHQNYPNPFNPVTTIQFDVPEISDITIVVYDAMGRKINVLAESTFNPGYHTVHWNGTDLNGRNVGSGLYFYKLQSNSGFQTIQKMVLMR
jgi:hypothetical protein